MVVAVLNNSEQYGLPSDKSLPSIEITNERLLVVPVLTPPLVAAVSVLNVSLDAVETE